MVAGVLLDAFLRSFRGVLLFYCIIQSSRFQRMKQMKKVIGWSLSWFQLAVPELFSISWERFFKVTMRDIYVVNSVSNLGLSGSPQAWTTEVGDKPLHLCDDFRSKPRCQVGTIGLSRKGGFGGLPGHFG